MNDLVPFVLAALTLLALPGPTNMLMAAVGASGGFARAVPQVVAVLAGYFLAIMFWSEVVGAAATNQPMVPVAAKFVAAAFLIWSGWKLWSAAGRADLERHGITLSRVFATTLVNPKGLVFALAIFPQVGFGERVPYLGVFAVLVVGTAIGWMVLGMMAAKSSRGWLTSARVERVTSVVLAVFAVVLVGQTVEGMVGH